ncbi:MAG: hypothetical protein K2P35_15175 [Lachnospiraceae bacterium]|nr:hypothetical protein [Lachnospiraceae bacterium]
MKKIAKRVNAPVKKSMIESGLRRMTVTVRGVCLASVNSPSPVSLFSSW